VNRIRKYQSLRRKWPADDYQTPRRVAFDIAFVPIRLHVALHVLRGRPAIYRVHYEDHMDIDKGNSNLLVASCTVDRAAAS
jgi:hypothetical protein